PQSPREEEEEDGAEAEEPVGIHHSLAEPATQYTKRPNVFRLQTADRRLFLFQALTEEEMLSWISRLNLAAAILSSPAFPAAVGSQRRFVRPILPTAPSRSPPVRPPGWGTPRAAQKPPLTASSLAVPAQEEQLKCHEQWLERVARELEEHQRNLPDKRGRELDEYQLKKEYLIYE
ncbi:PSD4 protein, partial [Urocolius indicus]|nr:PSD4 protein [Urocolius indicus]